MNQQRITLDRAIHTLWVLGAVALLAWLLYVLRAVLIPFFVALLLAYLLDPWVRRVQRVVRNRPAAVLITLTLVALLVFGFFMVLGPLVAREVERFTGLMSDELPRWVQLAQDTPWMHDVLEQVNAMDLQQYLTADNLVLLGRKALPGFWQGLSSVFGLLVGLVGAFTTLIYLVFVLIDEEKVKDAWHGWIPPKYRTRVIAVAADVERAMDLYFRGQLKIALVLTLVYVTGFSLIGLPLALVLGLLAGLLSVIPYFSLLTVPMAWLAAGLLSLEEHRTLWPILALVLLVYVVAYAVDGLWLTPRIQGKNTGLRPEYILLTLSVWGSLLGVAGMIVALPLTTVIISYYRRVVLQEAGGPAPAAGDTPEQRS